MDWNKAFNKDIAEDQKKLDKFMKMMDGIKDGDHDGNEVINVQFTSEQIDKILKYQDLIKEETIQDAIIAAIDIAINAHYEVSK